VSDVDPAQHGRQKRKRSQPRNAESAANRGSGTQLAKVNFPRSQTVLKSGHALDSAVEQHLQGLTAAGYPNCALGLRYAAQVSAGHIPACKWVKLAVQRHERDLSRIGSRGWKYSLNLDDAEKIMRNMQNFREIKGPRAGQPLQLAPWQCFIFFTLLAWVHAETGYRRFRYALCFVPRGNGKTTMVAPLSLCMLALDGEGGAEIYAAAVTRQQAKLVFTTARFMAAREKDFCSLYDIKISSTVITQAVSASEFRPLSRDASTMDGLNVYLAVLDEFAQHKSREVHDVLVTATGKRKQSLIFGISTASSNQSGVGYEQWKYAQQVLEQKVHDEQYFCILYTIDENDDWTKESTHQKANPNWGVSVMPDVIANLCEKAQQVPALQNAFKQKHLNIWTSAATAWMNMQTWRKMADPTLTDEMFEGMECIEAVDLASKIDLCAKIKLFRREIDDVAHYYVKANFWLPQATVDRVAGNIVDDQSASSAHDSRYTDWVEKGWITACPGETNDFTAIEQTVKDDATKYIIEDFAYDPWQALQMATNLDKEGIPVIEYRPTVANFSPPMKEVEALVREGRLHHDGNPVLDWCVGCTLMLEDMKGNIYPRKDKNDKTQKIDGLVALLMAMGRRMAIDNDEREPSLSFVG
jgi:phage terminase large subunit-like protein